MRRIFFKAILILLSLSCSCISDFDKELIKNLNEKYPAYEFKYHYVTVLEVHPKKDRTIDTTEIVTMYKEVFFIQDTTCSKPSPRRIGFQSFVVYNNNNEFCFQISYDFYGKQEFIFRDKVVY